MATHIRKINRKMERKQHHLGVEKKLAKLSFKRLWPKIQPEKIRLQIHFPAVAVDFLQVRRFVQPFECI